MVFPTYQWLKDLSDENNYIFLIFGCYEGSHGIISYQTGTDFCPTNISYTIYDGRRIFENKMYPFNEFAYNSLQTDFVNAHKRYVKSLLADCSSTWVNEDNTVKEDCCIPF